MFGVKNFMRSFQKRDNYLYKGVEIALKWSVAWGYHMELEVVVNNKKKQLFAEKKIYSVADELGVKVMTNEELMKFTKKAEEDYERKNSLFLYDRSNLSFYKRHLLQLQRLDKSPYFLQIQDRK
jgi:hypothetical protein